jgi:hypothetical protein
LECWQNRVCGYWICAQQQKEGSLREEGKTVMPLVNEGQRSRRWEKESGCRKEREVGIVGGMVCTRRGGGVKMPALLRRLPQVGRVGSSVYTIRHGCYQFMRCNFASDISSAYCKLASTSATSQEPRRQRRRTICTLRSCS